MLTDAGPSIVVGTRTRGTRVSSSLSKSLRLSFPQYGFKAGRSDEAFPTYRLAIVLRALGFPRESLLGVRGKGLGSTSGGALGRSTPGALAPVRVMLAQSIFA